MNSKAWRMSASVIIAIRSSVARDSLMKRESTVAPFKGNFISSHKSDVNILSLRRGQSDKHLPGIHVFPGGHLDEADTSLAWIDLYNSFGYEESSFASISTGGGIEHLPEYKETINESLPGWMSLRLCAIRETFEESGILLCRSPSSVAQGVPFASFVILNELSAWQSRVRADPRQMLALCRSAGCVPDVWGLHLWSNWLTPTQQKVRHNSIFFLSVIHSLPTYSLDRAEMDELKCCSALELINLAHAGKIRLANPQFYEAARLTNFKDADVLAAFASNRAKQGCPRIMPVQEKAKDGMLFILPGDSAYPKQIDSEQSCGLVKREETLEELRDIVGRESGTLHRNEVLSGSPCQRVVVQNFVPPYQHVLPTIPTDLSKCHL